MILKQCYLTHNDCYAKPTYIKGNPTGIVVHDTGAGNPNLRRYIQARSDNPDAKDINADLGKNTSGNHWNKSQSAGESNRWACVHAFIGKNAAGVVEVYETLPYNICCWGVGDGKYGSYNYNPQARIQFEICDDGYKDAAYFEEAFESAAEYCAYLCLKFGFGVDKICSHHESYLAGYGGNHGDCDIWLAKFGKDMNWFRAKVNDILKGKDESPMTADEKKAFDTLKRKVELLDNKYNNIDKYVESIKPYNVVYHKPEELPNYARPVITAMHDDGIFAGAGANDMALPYSDMRMLCILASNGVFGRKYKKLINPGAEEE